MISTHVLVYAAILIGVFLYFYTVRKKEERSSAPQRHEIQPVVYYGFVSREGPRDPGAPQLDEGEIAEIMRAKEGILKQRK